MESICSQAQDAIQQSKANYRQKEDYPRGVTKNESNQYTEACKFLATRLKVEEVFLQRLMSYHQHRLCDKDISDLLGLLHAIFIK